MRAKPILQLKSITKHYPGVTALDKVSFELMPGEIHALIGENGAGKSTLIKILSGCIVRDEGEIYLNGKAIGDLTPRLSEDLGISVIYQEFNLIPYLSIVENIFLGSEIVRHGLRDQKKMLESAQEIFDMFKLNLDPRERVANLSIAQQQMVEISKALSKKTSILIMDEPSAPLTSIEIDKMFEIMRSMKQKGVAIIYISHRIEEIFEIADKITVLRDGQYIKTLDVAETNRDELIRLMVGREISGYFPKADYAAGDEILRVENLTNNKIKNISFSLRKHEILGLAGLIGAGRTETARAIFGADPLYSGKITLKGQEVAIKSPNEAIAKGIGLIPEDRKQHGLLLNLDVRMNLTFAVLKLLSRFGLIQKHKEGEVIDQYVRDLKVKCTTYRQLIANLSGGNQQKVILAKWLARNCDVLIVDEPTRGIDVGSKHEIYELLRKLAKEGKAIIMISSEMPELINISDRIIVMTEGEITGELTSADEFKQEVIMDLACFNEEAKAAEKK